MARVYESMTRVPLVAFEPGVRRGWDPKHLGAVRVWREEPSLEAACDPDNADIFFAIEALGADAGKLAIIQAIERLPRIAAIEVVDDAGNGALLYPNWS